jgi:hypothetical protein
VGVLHRCDVGLQCEMAESAASFAAGGRITGVLHASGVLHDAIISQQSAALVREVYAAKAAHHLIDVRRSSPATPFRVWTSLS